VRFRISYDYDPMVTSDGKWDLHSTHEDGTQYYIDSYPSAWAARDALDRMLKAFEVKPTSRPKAAEEPPVGDVSSDASDSHGAEPDPELVALRKRLSEPAAEPKPEPEHAISEESLRHLRAARERFDEITTPTTAEPLPPFAGWNPPVDVPAVEPEPVKGEEADGGVATVESAVAVAETPEVPPQPGMIPEMTYSAKAERWVNKVLESEVFPEPPPTYTPLLDQLVAEEAAAVPPPAPKQEAPSWIKDQWIAASKIPEAPAYPEPAPPSRKGVRFAKWSMGMGFLAAYGVAVVELTKSFL